MVKLNLGEICAQFNPNTRVRLQISSGSFPAYSRNLGLGESFQTATNGIKANQTLFVNNERVKLSLPVINNISL